MADLAGALRLHSVHDPYVLVVGPDNLDRPGCYAMRVVLAVPEDRPLDPVWTASSLERARDLLPAALVRRPWARTTPRPGLVEQWEMLR